MSLHHFLIGTYTATSAPAGRGKGNYSLSADTGAHTSRSPQLGAFEIRGGATLQALPSPDLPRRADRLGHLALTPAGVAPELATKISLESPVPIVPVAS